MKKKKSGSISMSTNTKTTETEEIVDNSLSFGAAWFWRIFHTLLMLGGSYAVIITTVIEIPVIIPFMLGGLGFSVTSTMSNAEYIVAFCAGLFLTLWLVILDFLIIRAFAKLYRRNIDKTVSKNKDGKAKW